MLSNKYLLVIAGPTAVGKTDLSIQLARHFKTEILSADSRQFYKEMNIGTAKPSKEELEAVPHHFINNLSIQEEYTAGIYETEALTLLEKLYEKYDVVVLTGGSGLFIKMLCEGMDDIPEVKEGVRETLNKEFESKGLEELLNELKLKDPVYYEQVDKANPIRIIRALEVCRSTGKPFSSFRTNIKKERPFKTIKIGLNREREELYQRIDLRMDQMLEAGLIEEVKGLIPFKDKNALQTVGYSEVFDFLEGKYDHEEMIRLLKRNSRRYAKRQLTWFGKDKEFVWFDPKEINSILNYVESKMM